MKRKCRTPAPPPRVASCGPTSVLFSAPPTPSPLSQVRWAEGGALAWLKVDHLAPADAPAAPSRNGKRGRGTSSSAGAAASSNGGEGEGEGEEEEEGDAPSGGGKGRATTKRARPSSTAQSSRRKSTDSSVESGKGRDAEASGKWSKRHSRAADAWEEALNALQPDSEEEGAAGGEQGEGGEGDGGQGGEGGNGEAGRRPRATAPASSSSAPSSAPAPASSAPTRDPRLQGFRIGGQSETAEERGEGWCGPWSTARALLERRAEAMRERMDELGGAPPPPLVKWEPQTGSRRGGKGRRDGGGGVGVVPSLQAIAVQFVAANIDCVEDFGCLTPAVQHALATELCRRR